MFSVDTLLRQRIQFIVLIVNTGILVSYANQERTFTYRQLLDVSLIASDLSFLPIFSAVFYESMCVCVCVESYRTHSLFPFFVLSTKIDE